MTETQNRQRGCPAGRFLRWLRAFAELWLADMLLVGGAGAVTAGIALLSPPAGWIAGGCFAIGGAIAILCGGGREDGDDGS